MNRVLIHFQGTWMEWSTILDVPTTTGMDLDDMYAHLSARGINRDDADTAVTHALKYGTSVRDQRDPSYSISLAALLRDNNAGINGEAMPVDELVERYLVKRETLY